MTIPNRPAKLPLQYVTGGDTWLGFRFRVKDDQDQPIDLPAAGWTNWKAQFRPTRGSGAFVELDVDTSDANNGWIGISCSALATEDMGGSGGFDVQAEDSGGESFTWVEGDIDWRQGYTR